MCTVSEAMGKLYVIVSASTPSHNFQVTMCSQTFVDTHRCGTCDQEFLSLRELDRHTDAVHRGALQERCLVYLLSMSFFVVHRGALHERCLVSLLSIEVRFKSDVSCLCCGRMFS